MSKRKTYYHVTSNFLTEAVIKYGLRTPNGAASILRKIERATGWFSPGVGNPGFLYVWDNFPKALDHANHLLKGKSKGWNDYLKENGATHEDRPIIVKVSIDPQTLRKDNEGWEGAWMTRTPVPPNRILGIRTL